MNTNQDAAPKDCPSIPLSFSLNVGYERSKIMGTGKDHRELAKKVKKKLYRDLFDEERQAQWKYQDALITAGINHLANQTKGMSEESSEGFNALVPKSKIERVIRPIALEVFANEDFNFKALLEHLNGRLALLPGGLTAKEVEFFGCRYCGPPPCWEYTAKFSIREQDSTKAYEISINPPKEGEIDRSISVPVLVTGTFTCTDLDYRLVFGGQPTAMSATQ